MAFYSEEVISQPPFAVVIGGICDGGFSGEIPFDSLDDAWSAAMAAATEDEVVDPSTIPNEGTSVNTENQAQFYKDGEDYKWTAYAAHMRFRLGGYSGTSYLRIWYKITRTTTLHYDEDPYVVNTMATDGDVVIAFAGTVAIPGNYSDYYTGSGEYLEYSFAYTFGDETDLPFEEPIMPDYASHYSGEYTITNQIQIIKYSCLPDYIPPDDGSANGFPV